jgi:transitional endoplasmic reticulum ATPase
MMECTECNATFLRSEATTPAFGTLSCPVCGITDIKAVDSSTLNPETHIPNGEERTQFGRLPRADPEISTTSKQRTTMVCTDCATTFPRGDVSTPSFGAVGCPKCKSTAIREIDSESATEELSEEIRAVESLTTTYEDIGGLTDELAQVREMVELPLNHPELFRALGINPPNGVLLHGPPGTGKTLMARAIASETNAYFETISGPEVVSKYYGESEEHLRDVFDEAAENEPGIVLIDELDSIAPKREDTTGEVERRIVAQLLSLMDGLDERGRVAVIGTTNRVNAIDPALRRPGRFGREIEIGVPNENGREEILRIHTRGMPLADDLDLEACAEHSHRFVGADIENLTKESAMHTLRRVRPDLDFDSETIDAEVLASLSVTATDFTQALKGIEPSALREVFVEIPNVSWEDIGGLGAAKEQLQQTIQWPLAYSEAFERANVTPATGVLLYGPPGTGKTLLAKAVASEAQSNFISIKGPELLDRYVGESERGVREVFSKARENAPTVVFFDEIDAIAGERGRDMSDAGVSERVVSQLLIELDGLEPLEDVVVIAATNRPDLIDDALARPGRLDRYIHVGTPDATARREIFAIHARDRPLGDDIDLDTFASQTDGYVGADIEAVCREAASIAVREFVRLATADGATVSPETIELTRDHFERALSEIESGTTGDGHRSNRFES